MSDEEPPLTRKPPSAVTLTANALSSPVPPNERSQILLPLASTRTTQKSRPPKLGLVLLPLTGESDTPTRTNPPSSSTAIALNPSTPLPPYDASHRRWPEASKRTSQKSFVPKLGL